MIAESELMYRPESRDRMPLYQEYSAAFSPDCLTLAYCVELDDKNAAGVWLYDIVTGERQKLPAPPELEHVEPSFSPHGSRILWFVGPRRANPVYDIESRRFASLPLWEESSLRLLWLGDEHFVFARWFKEVHKGGGVSSKKRLFRIRWDGTRIEEIFPERRRLTDDEARVLMRVSR